VMARASGSAYFIRAELFQISDFRVQISACAPDLCVSQSEI
jgi:hypothetical protein